MCVLTPGSTPSPRAVDTPAAGVSGRTIGRNVRGRSTPSTTRKAEHESACAAGNPAHEPARTTRVSPEVGFARARRRWRTAAADPAERGCVLSTYERVDRLLIHEIDANLQSKRCDASTRISAAPCASRVESAGSRSPSLTTCAQPVLLLNLVVPAWSDGESRYSSPGATHPSWLVVHCGRGGGAVSCRNTAHVSIHPVVCACVRFVRLTMPAVRATRPSARRT
jgi:hypothetical protein